jgi:U3 small nucleolar RNA-associated protein 15
MAQPYQKVELKRFAKAHTVDTSESSFWKKFRFPILLQQYAAVTCIDFCPVSPNDFVVTSSAKAQVFDAKTNEVRKSLNRFKEVAYSARFRSDGQLIVAGGEEGLVRVFDANSKSVLRTFSDNSKRPVRVTRFSPNNKHIMAGSDDCTVTCWDLQGTTSLFTLTGHKDQVRAGIVSPASENIWISGSHDHTVKVWDTRNQECLATLEHQAPIEDIVALPGGGIVISAAANEIKIWDVVGGFRLLDTLSAHQKAVTSLSYDPSRSRLFTSSLDSTVKVFDTNTYKIIHVIKYPAPILCAGISPKNTHLVTGMSDGMLSIRHRVVKLQEEASKMKSFSQPFSASKAKGVPVINRAYLLRGQDYVGAETDYKIEKVKRQRLRRYDQHLKKFQYKKALDAALEAKDPLVIVSLFEEFIRRNALSVPLSGRNEVTLRPLLQFCVANLRNPKYTTTILPVANHLLDLYAPTIGLSPTIDKLYLSLQERVNDEIEFQKQLTSLMGIFETLFASSLKATAEALPADALETQEAAASSSAPVAST